MLMNKLDYSNKIKKLKLLVLQQRYKYLTDIILRLEKHVDFLFLSNYLDSNHKNEILGKVFIISKNLNTSYNNFIIEKLDYNYHLDTKINELLSLFKTDIDDNFLIDKILPIIKKSTDQLPLFEQENELFNIINNNGYDNIVDLIEFYNK
jgi:hypothetical protein